MQARVATRERAASIRIVADPGDSTKTRSSTEDDLDAYKRETEAISVLAMLIPYDSLSKNVSGVMAFITHVAKWLYKQQFPEDGQMALRLKHKSEIVEAAVRAVCEIVLSKPAEDITLRAWNIMLDKYGEDNPFIWVYVLKAFVYMFEIIPQETSKRLLSAGEKSQAPYQILLKTVGSGRKSSLGILGGGGASNGVSTAGPTNTIRELFVPILEDLPAARHTTLAALCMLLQRDRRNRKSVVAAFGPWMLHERNYDELLKEATSGSAAFLLCAQTLEIMVTMPDVLFHEFDMPAFLEPVTFSQEAEESSLKQLIKRGPNLRSVLKRFSSSGKETSSTSANESDSQSIIVTVKAALETDCISPSKVAIDSKLADDMKDRPARSRQSLERVYGRAPPLPPPKEAPSPQLNPTDIPHESPKKAIRDSPPSRTHSPPSRTHSPPSRTHSPPVRFANTGIIRPAPVTPSAAVDPQAITGIPTSPLTDKLSSVPIMTLDGASDRRGVAVGVAPAGGNEFQEQLRVAIKKNTEVRQNQLASHKSSEESSISGAANGVQRKPPPIPRRSSTASSSGTTTATISASQQTTSSPGKPCPKCLKLLASGCVCNSGSSSPPKPSVPQVPADKMASAPQANASMPIRKRTPPPIPKLKSPSVTAALEASARRRSLSKEAIGVE